LADWNVKNVTTNSLNIIDKPWAKNPNLHTLSL
jgi:hypothetical protein